MAKAYKEKEYFSHDYNTRLDDKIKKLIIKHGCIGYGLFWGIIEDLYNNKNSLKTDYEAIAYEYRVPIDLVESLIKDFDLFKISGENFSSASVKKRLKKRGEKSEKARKAIQARWSKDTDVSKNDTNVIRDEYERNTIKEKKRKEKNNKEDSKGFTPPSLDDVINFFKGKNYSAAAAKRAFEYYDAGGWKDGSGKQVRNWKQKMIAVWFKPENQTQVKQQLTIEDELAAKL